MPVASFGNPVNTVLTEEPLTLHHNGWHAWAGMGIEIAQCGPCLSRCRLGLGRR